MVNVKRVTQGSHPYTVYHDISIHRIVPSVHQEMRVWKSIEKGTVIPRTLFGADVLQKTSADSKLNNAPISLIDRSVHSDKHLYRNLFF